MKDKICQKCGNKIAYKTKIKNKIIYNHNRKYCFLCSPYIEYAAIDIIKLTNTQKQILQGHLLGDGSLSINKTSKNARLMISRIESDNEYLFWTKSYFLDFLTDKSIYKRSRYDNRTQKTYNCIELNTRTSPIFTDYYNKWYPKGKKIVPKNLILTPLIIAVWIADDGYVYHGSTINTLNIKFSTQGFDQESVIFLYEQLKLLYGKKIRIEKFDKYNQFNILVTHTPTAKLIVNDIQNVFPPMKRKSIIWQTLI